MRRAPPVASEGGWLVQQDDERFFVRPGAALVVTEGVKIVGYFHVEEVTDQRWALACGTRSWLWPDLVTGSGGAPTLLR